MKTPKVGDVVKSIAGGERLPVGTVVQFIHPVYQGPNVAIRVAIADGSTHWSCTGWSGLRSTRDIKSSYGWSDLTILHLPEENDD